MVLLAWSSSVELLHWAVRECCTGLRAWPREPGLASRLLVTALVPQGTELPDGGSQLTRRVDLLPACNEISMYGPPPQLNSRRQPPPLAGQAESCAYCKARALASDPFPRHIEIMYIETVGSSSPR